MALVIGEDVSLSRERNCERGLSGEEIAIGIRGAGCPISVEGTVEGTVSGRALVWVLDLLAGNFTSAS